MSLAVKSVSVEPFEAPLKRPFVTALGRKVMSPNTGVVVTLSDGARGYGEASGSLAFAYLAPERLEKALLKAARWAKGKGAEDPGALAEGVWKLLDGCAPAAAAFEAALWAAVADSRGVPQRALFGGALDRLETDITISAWTDREKTEEAVAEAYAEGFRVFKIKVGGKFADDLARVKAVRHAAPKCRVLLDGNQGLTPASTLKLVEASLKLGSVDLMEQPLPKADIKKMPALVKRCPVPIALDESVQTPEDAARVVGEGACGAVNVKVAKSGLARSLKIAAVARAAKLPLMIGCMTETAAGLDASAALAMGTGFFRFVDLDADHLLKPCGRKASFTRRGPVLTARQ
jgi:L-alanine-DL-glutamate epimerase-like enolase superfamily enzyme